jgi:acyl-CoA thioester hydrolase
VIPSCSTSRVRVRYAETDAMGVVYYANYFVWFEVARTDLLRHAGWSYREMERDGFSLPVIEAHCEYKQWAMYDDEIDVRTSGSLLSPVRVQFEYEVTRLADRTVIAVGRTVHATLDRGGRPCRIPQRVRQLFAQPAGGGSGRAEPDAPPSGDSGPEPASGTRPQRQGTE